MFYPFRQRTNVKFRQKPGNTDQGNFAEALFDHILFDVFKLVVQQTQLEIGGNLAKVSTGRFDLPGSVLLRTIKTIT